MKHRDRVIASLERKNFDRLPIRHLAVAEVDEELLRYFQTEDYDILLDHLGHDFREICPEYCGPAMENLESEHGIISALVWGQALQRSQEEVGLLLADVSSVSYLDRYSFASVDWYDYSSIKDQCLRYSDYARIFGYCELDFINGISGLRGQEQVLIDIGLKDPIFLKLSERRFQFMYEHLKRGLDAGQGLIEFVHLGDDLGSQQGLLISPETFLELFGQKYRMYISLAHQHGAKVMMHVCGSVVGIIPTLIDLGVDVLDVVQTNADGMDLRVLKKKFGDRLTFAGTMCVQKIIPFGSQEEVRCEVLKRLELFKDGGLIIGPSHQIQPDAPLENILEMYRASGGLTE